MNFKKTLRLLLISLAIGLGITLVNFLMYGADSSIQVTLRNFAINASFAFFLTFVNERLVDFLNRYATWQEQPALRLALGIVGSVVVTMVTLFFLMGFVRVVVFDGSVQQFLDNQRLSWYVYGVLITLVITLIFHAFYFYKELQQSKIKKQKVLASSATAQFDALKNQLDPHFLFNSLNVLVSLIEENPDAAVQFTTSLSKVYRYVLEQRGKQLISLQEELKFARTYVGLLKMRFEDSLEVSLPQDIDNNDLHIVPLSLQLLIENAVKHNVISAMQPLKLKIYQQGNQLVVQNNLQTKATLEKSTGVGLTNIASRYEMITDRPVMINPSKRHYIVQLPLVTQQETTTYKTTDMETTAQELKFMKARDRVRDIKDFYDDVWRTMLILAFLALINWMTSDFPWVIFPAIGMGIGVFFKYLRTFDRQIIWGREWQESKIQELMNDQNF